jgi:hypothetical protein
MITHELLRELLKHELPALQTMAEFVPNEIVYKALIVREFMHVREIQDLRSGLREFYVFERERLERLGAACGGIRRSPVAQDVAVSTDIPALSQGVVRCGRTALTRAR